LAGSTFASRSNNVGSELLMAAKTSPATLFLEAVGTNSRLTARRVPTESIYFQEHGTRVHLSDQRAEVSVTCGSFLAKGQAER